MTQTVVVQRGPDVQLLGDAVLLQGRALRDVYRLAVEGVAVAQRRDGIRPSDQLRQVIAALAAASSATTATNADRRGADSRTSSRTGELVGVEEVARMTGYGSRRVCRLAPDLGGWRSRRRGRPWVFDRGLVLAYLTAMEDEA